MMPYLLRKEARTVSSLLLKILDCFLSPLSASCFEKLTVCSDAAVLFHSA